MSEVQNLLAIDIGQSGSRYFYDGTLFSIKRGMFSGEPIENTLDAILADLNIKADTVALSLTGLYGDVGDVSRFFKVCNKHLGATQVSVIDDGLANLAGSLQGESGVALVLGGGVVAVGGKDQKLSHSDGLSSHFGDEGSGYWLGSRGLTRALATRDLRDEHHELLEVFKEEIAAYDNLKSKNGPEASLLAIQSAQKVLLAADKGIEIAEHIRDEGARLLAKTVSSAWQKVGNTGEDFKLTISGGLSKNENYTQIIFQEVRKLEKNAELIKSKGDNIDGAIWISQNWVQDIRPMLGWARN
jgi:N-acetylglucosamine kinase-like BadF-type ATPase